MKHLLNMTVEELSDELKALGQPGYRAKQVLRWVWGEHVYDFAAMTDLPAALRQKMSEEFAILSGRVVAQSQSPDHVIKLLIQWADGERTESVLIPSTQRMTVCVSTQVGCAMGCRFCASGMHGMKRNLSSGEIVEQVIQLGLAAGANAADEPLDEEISLDSEASDPGEFGTPGEEEAPAESLGGEPAAEPRSGEPAAEPLGGEPPVEPRSGDVPVEPANPPKPMRMSHVVFMGMGEPLANYEATVSAVRTMIDPARMGISARHITVSTVGLPQQIRRLAKEGLPITLALSLHAPNDAMRKQIIPVAGKYPLEEVIEACQQFYDSRHRQVTLEYVVLPGVNDTNVCAESLSRISRRLAANVNLIAFNPVESLPFRRPSGPDMHAFADMLEHKGVNVQIRRSRGLRTDAACGQLRRRVAQADPQDEGQVTPENGNQANPEDVDS